MPGLGRNLGDQRESISIIIPVFNRAHLIGETLDSILEQSYNNWECLVIDDHSTDDTVKKVKAYTEKYHQIKLFFNSRKKGAQGARNTGIEKADGTFVLFLDSDDYLAKNCLSARMDMVRTNPHKDYYCFPTALFREQPFDTDLMWNYLNNSENDLLRFLKTDMPWHTCGVLWRKETLILLEGWDENLFCWQDWDIHLRALIYKNLSYIKSSNNAVDSFYRIEGKYRPISSQEYSSKSIVSKMFLIDKFASLLPMEQKQVRIEFARLIYRISLQIVMTSGIKEATGFFRKNIAGLNFSKLYFISWNFYFRNKHNDKHPYLFLKSLGLIPRLFPKSSLLENYRTHLTAKLN